MKPTMHSKQWLRWARKQAHLTKQGLADLSGLSYGTLSALELGDRGGSPETWASLDEALYSLAPIAFVDESALLDYARKCKKVAKGCARCRLSYTSGVSGVVFTDLAPEDESSRPGDSIVVTWVEAEALLRAQMAALR